jgi:hypothetical protein
MPRPKHRQSKTQALTTLCREPTAHRQAHPGTPLLHVHPVEQQTYELLPAHLQVIRPPVHSSIETLMLVGRTCSDELTGRDAGNSIRLLGTAEICNGRCMAGPHDLESEFLVLRAQRVADSSFLFSAAQYTRKWNTQTVGGTA